MALTRRYEPPHQQGPLAYGMDFSTVIPWGMTLASATLTIFKNTQPPLAQADFTVSPMQLADRMAWCLLTGGVTGTDYLLQWSATDNRGNVWERSVALLCSATS